MKQVVKWAYEREGWRRPLMHAIATTLIGQRRVLDETLIPVANTERRLAMVVHEGEWGQE